MRLRFTIILLVLNLIAFGSLAYLERRADISESTKNGLSSLVGREIVEADRIELRGQNLDRPRVLVREGSAWSISEPLQWSANYFAVNRILNQLQFIEEEASFSVADIEKSGQTLADYGLEDPLITLLIGEDGEALTLSVGTLTEIGNNVYLLGPDQKEIFVVNREVVDSLLVDLADLRTREIFDIPVFEIEALGLQIGTPGSPAEGDLKVRLARTKNGWLFEAPLTAEADPTLVSNAINNLTAAKVATFVEAADPVLLGLDDPSMRVTLHGNKRRQTLLIGNRDEAATQTPAYFAKLENNPTFFTVAAAPFDELRQAQEALRERDFVTFEPDALTAINLTEAGRQVRLQKLETGGWQVIESNSGADIQPHRADPAVMRQLITDLGTLRAEGFAFDAPSPVELENLGFGAPRRTVELTLEGQAPLTLTLAHPTDENERLYARTDRAAFVYQVPRQATIRKLPLNALHYRNRVLEQLPEAAKVTAIRLENLETDEVLLDLSLGSLDALWPNAVEDLPEATAEATLELVSALRRFTVEEYLADEFGPAYEMDARSSRPWVYKLTATIALPGGETVREENREYFFTERLGGTRQVGGSPLHETIFDLPQDTIEALHVFADTLEPTPESAGTAVPEPERTEPLPEPQPQPQPQTQPQPTEDAPSVDAPSESVNAAPPEAGD